MTAKINLQFLCEQIINISTISEIFTCYNLWNLTSNNDLFFFCRAIQFIPMPVLYGVFLYMGVASLNGVQVSLSDLISSC